MSRTQRKYDHEYKVQAVKLAREIGGAKAAKELGIPEGTIHTWLKAVRAGTLDIGDGAHTPESFPLIMPSSVFMAMNIILWFLLTSDGWLRKKNLLPREIHFPLSDAGFLYPDP